MMPPHRDFAGAPVTRQEPDSPHPKPAIPAGTGHPWACRYPVEIGWTQQAREKWDAICEAATFAANAQRWLYGLTIAIISIMVTISIATGSSCRAAGAQEQRVVRTERDVDGLKTLIADQAQRIREVDEQQTERYERLLEITSRIDARLVAEQEQRQQQAKHP